MYTPATDIFLQIHFYCTFQHSVEETDLLLAKLVIPEIPHIMKKKYP